MLVRVQPEEPNSLTISPFAACRAAETGFRNYDGNYEQLPLLAGGRRAQRYGVGGDDFEPCVHDTDPSRPINSWKEAWESAKKNAKVAVLFHDLRHTCVTRMLERGVPLSVVASILGWSAATTARMAKRYGHIGQVAQRQAVSLLDTSADRLENAKGGSSSLHWRPV